MLLAGKIFCCPRIQLFFTMIVVGIINTGANYAEPPVAASLIPIVNTVTICGNVFRGFIPTFANLANFRIQTWMLLLSFQLCMVFFGVSCNAGDDVDGWLFEIVVTELLRLWNVWSVKFCLLFQNCLGNQQTCKFTFPNFRALVQGSINSSQSVIFLIYLPFQTNHLLVTL